MKFDRPVFITGIKLKLFRLKLISSHLVYFFSKKRFPHFILSSKKGGFLNTLKIRKKLKIKKIIRFGSNYYLSLEKPHFPSKQWKVMLANGGMNMGVEGAKRNFHTDLAILAVTSRCAFNCKHCYEKHNINDSDDISLETWSNVINGLQQKGVSIVALSGGEPMLRFEDLVLLLNNADKTISDFHIYTSGYGVTEEKAMKLKKAGLHAAAIGLDDFSPKRQNEIRGFFGAYDIAINAISSFTKAGILTYINTCLSKELVNSGGLWQLAELAKKHGIAAIRLLEPKTVGGYFYSPKDDLFTDKERRTTEDFFLKMNNNKEYSDYPVVFWIDYGESPERAGCGMGGFVQMHIDAKGNVNPCVFMPVTFGNIKEQSVTEIFKRMRQASPHHLKQGCPSFTLSPLFKKLAQENIQMPFPYQLVKQEWHELYQISVPQKQKVQTLHLLN